MRLFSSCWRDFSQIKLIRRTWFRWEGTGETSKFSSWRIFCLKPNFTIGWIKKEVMSYRWTLKNDQEKLNFGGDWNWFRIKIAVSRTKNRWYLKLKFDQFRNPKNLMRAWDWTIKDELKLWRKRKKYQESSKTNSAYEQVDSLIW